MKRLVGCGAVCLAALGLALADEPAKPKDKENKSVKVEKTDTAKDTVDSLLGLMIKNREETATVLAKVTEEKSAKEFKPKLAKYTEEMDGLQERFKKLGSLSPEVEKKLRATFEAGYRAAATKLDAEVKRIMDKEWGPDLVSALKLPKKAPDPIPTSKPPVKGTAKSQAK